MLGKIPDADIVAGSPFAGFEREVAGKDFQERGFSCAVRPDEHDPLPALDPDVEVLIDDMVAVGLSDTFEAHHTLPAADRLRKFEMDRRLIGLRRLDPFHSRELLHAVLRLGGLARLGAEPRDEILEVLDLLLLVSVGG